MPGPLDGIKILEVNRVAPGSFLTMMLGDMGAEVIFVESPKAQLTRETDPHAQASSFLHRNKSSLCLDLKDAAGQEVLQGLAREMDVLGNGRLLFHSFDDRFRSKPIVVDGPFAAPVEADFEFVAEEGVVVGDVLVGRIDDPTAGRELAVTDGTAGGTSVN